MSEGSLTCRSNHDVLLNENCCTTICARKTEAFIFAILFCFMSSQKMRWLIYICIYMYKMFVYVYDYKTVHILAMC